MGPRPDGCDINHKDGIKTHNRAENLEYSTRKENMIHARLHGLWRNFGETHYNAKLTEEQVHEIRVAHNDCGVMPEEMSLPVAKRTIWDVILEKTWRGSL